MMTQLAPGLVPKGGILVSANDRAERMSGGVIRALEEFSCPLLLVDPKRGALLEESVWSVCSRALGIGPQQLFNRDVRDL